MHETQERPWQKSCRERALQSGVYKLQTWLDSVTARQLEHICQRDGLTKREAVQQAIQQLHEQNRDQASAGTCVSVRPVKVHDWHREALYHIGRDRAYPFLNGKEMEPFSFSLRGGTSRNGR